jgi:hypothetical protein
LQTDRFIVYLEVSMLNFRKILFLLLMSALGLLGLAGCGNPQQDSSIPWSRPADWEGQIPGMSGNSGSNLGR